MPFPRVRNFNSSTDTFSKPIAFTLRIHPQSVKIPSWKFEQKVIRNIFGPINQPVLNISRSLYIEKEIKSLGQTYKIGLFSCFQCSLVGKHSNNIGKMILASCCRLFAMTLNSIFERVKKEEKKELLVEISSNFKCC